MMQNSTSVPTAKNPSAPRSARRCGVIDFVMRVTDVAASSPCQPSKDA